MSFLRMPARRQRRWTSAEVFEATKRLESKGALVPHNPFVVVAPPKVIRTKAVDFREGTSQEGWCYEPFDAFEFRLTWAPSVNSCYANAKKGRIKTSKAREFEALALASLTEQNVPRRLLAHPMRILIEQHAPTARGDIDNGLKIVLDCLKKFGVIADDNREIVKEICVRDAERCKEPWIRVSISAILSEEAALAALEGVE